MAAEPKPMNLITICHDREGNVISEHVERVPDDGSYERGCRLLFDLACKALNQKQEEAPHGTLRQLLQPRSRRG